MSQFYFNSLADKGLNLQAIFNIENLPTEFKKSLIPLIKNSHRYNQLILLGHGGRRLWKEVKNCQTDQKSNSNRLTKIDPSDDPIDSFSAELTKGYFKNHSSVSEFKLLFPYSNSPESLNQQLRVLNFQVLGKLAGWHSDSPFRVGINSQWGTWFA
ncbi:MAG: hypothetical protein L3J46_04245, partial [Kangiellaceae bacterium]|nr:hypothetical protein [Kangiellaceae bacterium]